MLTAVDAVMQSIFKLAECVIQSEESTFQIVQDNVFIDHRISRPNNVAFCLREDYNKGHAVMILNVRTLDHLFGKV